MPDYYYQDGWPGAVRFPLPGASRSCGCGSFPPPFPPPNCGDRGEPLFLDSANVIYHLFNNQLSNLRNLGFPNQTPVQTILDGIDYWIGFLNITQWNIPNLKTLFPQDTFNNLQIFGQAVDAEFGNILASIATISGSSATPNSATNTDSIAFILTGPLNRNISANVLLSAASGNTLSILSDGLFNPPQNLGVNYTNNSLTITGGNTVTLPNPPSGWLGNVSADPASPQDGQYWYNTTSSQLKMRANGSTLVITT
jgi:hypothetical protein